MALVRTKRFCNI